MQEEMRRKLAQMVHLLFNNTAPVLKPIFFAAKNHRDLKYMDLGLHYVADSALSATFIMPHFEACLNLPQVVKDKFYVPV